MLLIVFLSVVCHTLLYYKKRSAVVEMGDRLATIDMFRRVGCDVPVFTGNWVPM